MQIHFCAIFHEAAEVVLCLVGCVDVHEIGLQGFSLNWLTLRSTFSGGRAAVQEHFSVLLWVGVETPVMAAAQERAGRIQPRSMPCQGYG